MMERIRLGTIDSPSRHTDTFTNHRYRPREPLNIVLAIGGMELPPRSETASLSHLDAFVQQCTAYRKPN